MNGFISMGFEPGKPINTTWYYNSCMHIWVEWKTNSTEAIIPQFLQSRRVRKN